MQASVTFTAAELAAGTTKVLLPAQGVGKVGVPLSLVCKLSADYAPVTATGIKYFAIKVDDISVTAFTATTAKIPTVLSLSSNVACVMPPTYVIGGTGYSVRDGQDKALLIQAPTGITGGAGSIEVILVYTVV